MTDSLLQPDRRLALGLAVAGASSLVASAVQAQGTRAALWLDATALGIVSDPEKDQTAAFQKAVDLAAASRTPLMIPAGTYRCSGLVLRPHCQIMGVAGSTRLVARSASPLFDAPSADHVMLSGLILEGSGELPANEALVALAEGQGVRVTQCHFQNIRGTALRLNRVGGEISGNRFSKIRDAALFAMDSQSLVISGNLVEECEDNGILVWTSKPASDGTIVTQNTIRRIGNRSGGSGQYGNGVNVFRAGDVIVSQNRIDQCSYSAIRGNAASNLHIVNNACSNLGEVALYAEFGFEGALIQGNTIVKAANGISVTNFNNGGRLAVVSGNLVRDLFLRADPETRQEGGGAGIFAEADTAISANVVENALRMGLGLGWGHHLRNVSATGNIIRNCGMGIGVSVTSGAGDALIASNLISGSKSGAIVGYDHLRVVTGDLSSSGSSQYPQLSISGNAVRNQS